MVSYTERVLKKLRSIQHIYDTTDLYGKLQRNFKFKIIPRDDIIEYLSGDRYLSIRYNKIKLSILNDFLIDNKRLPYISTNKINGQKWLELDITTAFTRNNFKFNCNTNCWNFAFVSFDFMQDLSTNDYYTKWFIFIM